MSDDVECWDIQDGTPARAQCAYRERCRAGGGCVGEGRYESESGAWSTLWDRARARLRAAEAATRAAKTEESRAYAGVLAAMREGGR